MRRYGIMPVEMGTPWAIIVAAFILSMFSVFAYFAVRERVRAAGREKPPRGFFWWLVMGEDGRVSTSQLQVALWSYAVAFAVLVIVLTNGILDPKFELQEQYLVLLGSPAAAAILAKGIASSRTDEGTLSKPKVPKDKQKRGLVKGLGDVISDDQGQLEIFDLQYLLFTVVALVVFFAGFFASNLQALPDLSWTLVGLTSVSAAGYVGKKLARDQAPVLTAVAPDWAPPGEWVTLWGRNLRLVNPEGADVVPEKIKFGGRLAKPRESPSATRIEAKVPEDLQPGRSIEVKVLRSDGIETGAIDFKIAGGPEITSVQPTRVVLEPREKNPVRRSIGNASDRKLVISGRGFGEIEGKQRKAAAVLLNGRPLDFALQEWRPTLISAQLPSFEAAQHEGYEIPGDVELVVHDVDGRPSKPHTVTLAQTRQRSGR